VKEEKAATAAAGRRAALLVGALNAVFLGMLAGAVFGLALLLVAFFHWRAGRLRPVPASFHVGGALLLEGFVLYLFLYVSPLLMQRAGLPLPSARTTPAILSVLFFSDMLALAALAYLWLRLRASGVGLAEIGLHTREFGRNVLYGLGGYLMLLPWVIGSALLASWVGSRFFPQVAPPFHPIQAITLGAHSPGVRLALLVVVSVGAPFLEEIFFRGLLYGALRRRFGVAVGVFASAAVFSLLHPQLPLGFLPILVLGAGFAMLTEWRQSLVPNMVAHALNNGVVWIALNLLFPPG
jgi:CAAX protease family protein